MTHHILPDTSTVAETVILANGLFPTHPVPLSILRNASYIVCCDGAIDNLSQTKITPHAIVGDCDSLSDDNKRKFATILHPISEQETNDLTKAINFCVAQGRKDIIILGATGKREDHTIGNISLLCEYQSYANVLMISDYGCFVPITEAATFESVKRQQVSIFCIDPKPISAEGLMYPIIDQVFTNWWQATLNESLSDEFAIYPSGRTILYRNLL